MDKVLREITSKSNSIGGILAAMVYQIDHSQKKSLATAQKGKEQTGKSSSVIRFQDEMPEGAS